MKTDLENKTGYNGQALQQLLQNDIYLNEFIVPYWLETPEDKGYGFFKVNMKIDPVHNHHTLLVEELAWNTEGRIGDKKGTSFRHEFGMDDFAEDPFQYLLLDAKGEPVERKVELVHLYSKSNSGFLERNVEHGSGGFCSFMYEALKQSMEEAGWYMYSPGWISVSSNDEDKIHAVLKNIVHFLKLRIFTDGKFPCAYCIY